MIKLISTWFVAGVVAMTLMADGQEIGATEGTNSETMVVAAMAESINHALEKSYVMDPPGNYRYGARRMCTGPEDKTDLTDGKHVVCKGGRIWFKKGAVGIWNLSEKGIGRVIIDLGKSLPIGKVKVYATRMPGAGVQLPPLRLCLLDEPQDVDSTLTDDKTEYVWTDSQIAKIPLPDANEVFVVTPTELNGYGVRARYVCVALLQGAMFDEIEVFAAPEENASSGFPVLRYGDMPGKMLFSGKRLLSDKPLMADMLIQLVKKSAGGREKGYFLSWWSDVEEDYAKAIARMDERACSEAVDATFRLNRECLASRFDRTALIVWSVTPYAAPNLLDVPDSPTAVARLNLLTGQKGLVAFNLAWAGEEKTTATVTLDNPPLGTELRRGHQSITPNGNRIADALLPMENGASIDLNPGQVEEIIVVVAPACPSKKLSLRIKTASGIDASATIEVKRFQTALPEVFDYPIFAWDYLDWLRPCATPDEIGKFLKPYHFNVAVLTGGPFRMYDNKEPLPAAFDDWDKALAAQPYCRWVYAAIWSTKKPGHPVGSDQWSAWYGKTLAQAVAFLEQRGFPRERIFLAPADEDHDPEIWSAAREVVDKVVPGVNLFATRYWPTSPEFLQSIDIFVAKRGSYRFAMNLLEFKEKFPEITMMQYDCGSTCDSDPYSFRLYPWENLSIGGQGIGLWTRSGNSAWTGSPYILFYDKANAPAELNVKEALSPSRRLEAFRAGLEDRWVLEEAKRLATQRLVTKPGDPFARGVLEFVDDSLERAFMRESDPYVAQDAIQWLVPQLDALAK